MNWNDEGILLSLRPHGETSLIVDALTRAHGRHAGLVRGGRRRGSGSLQPGLRANLYWNARLPEHLGYYRIESLGTTWAAIRDDPDALAALASMLALISAYLADREPHPALFAATLTTLATLTDPKIWPTAYAHWEIGLLRTLGYGLDLQRCAATGTAEDLIWVSRRNGRAVCRTAGEGHEERLLELPAFLIRGEAADAAGLLAALHLTGHFFEQEITHLTQRQLPDARDRLVRRFRARLA